MVKEQEEECRNKWEIVTVEGRKKWSPPRLCIGTGAFNLFIKDLELEVASEMVRIAEDTKLFWVIKTKVLKTQRQSM